MIDLRRGVRVHQDFRAACRLGHWARPSATVLVSLIALCKTYPLLRCKVEMFLGCSTCELNMPGPKPGLQAASDSEAAGPRLPGRGGRRGRRGVALTK